MASIVMEKARAKLRRTMGRLFLWKVFYMATVLVVGFPSSSEARSLPLEKAHLAVWKIHNVEPGDKFSSNRHRWGTTFAIELGSSSNTRYFLTNAHVLYHLLKKGASLKDLILSHKDGLRALKVAKILSVSGIYDLALIETTESVRDFLNLADSFSPRNSTHSLIGYPKRLLTHVRQTETSQYTDIHSFSFSVSRTKLRGFSGGPVLDKNGRVVGIFHSSTHNMIYAVKIEHVKYFIRNFLQNGAICAQPRFLHSCLAQDSEEVKNLAQEGDTLAQYQVGRLESYIPGMESHLASQSLKESADSKFPPSKYALATSYFEGEQGFVKNTSRAFREFLASAELGHAPAQDFVAQLYKHGVGTELNRKESRRWFQNAADQGYAISQ